MKKLPLNIFFIFLLFSGFIVAQNKTYRSDFQIWNDTSVSIPTKKTTDRNGKSFERMSFSFNGTLRFGQNVSHPVDARIGIGFNYRLNKHVIFAPDILYRSFQPTKNRKDYESRFRFAVIFENRWKHFSLNDRSQIEYRLRNSRSNTVFYKNRFHFDVPVTKNKAEIFTPFVSTEPYYNFQEGKWVRNEFFAGISKKFNKNFAADIFYLFVKDRNLPNTVNGIGTSLRFKIDRR